VYSVQQLLTAVKQLSEHHLLAACMQGKGVLSTYDPRDLFSREHARVKRAVRALLASPNVGAALPGSPVILSYHCADLRFLFWQDLDPAM
jgi:hypothetical protein